MKNTEDAAYKWMGLGIMIGVGLFYLSYCWFGSAIFGLIAGLGIGMGIIVIRWIYDKLLNKGAHK